MTTDELREAKQKAEDGISQILADLAQDTGLTPIAVDLSFLSIVSLGEHRSVAVGRVKVRLELA